jgi:O-antigen ligase
MQRLAFLMLWIFVFTIPWQNSVSLEAVGTVSQLVGIVAFLVAILSCVSSGHLRRPAGTLLLVGAFGMYALLSAGWSLDPNTTLIKALTIVELVAMFWMISEVVSDEEQIDGLLCAYVAGSAVSVIATFARFVAGTANQDLRYTAAGFNPNDAALTLALAIPMTFFLVVRMRALWAKLLLLAYAIAAPVAIALSGSRTGVLASCAAFLVSAAGLRQIRWSRRLMLVAALAVCAWCLVAFVPETSWTRISTISAQVDSGDLNQRTAIWAAGLKEFAAHPLLGVGEGAYLQISDRQLGEGFVAHNTFVSVLVELGIVGFLLFAAILQKTARAVVNLEGSDRMMWAALGATWFIGVLAATWETQKATWLLIALISVASRINAREFDLHLTDEEMTGGYEFSN